MVSLASLATGYTSISLAGWEYGNNSGEYKYGNSVIAKYLYISHKPQPNNYTCGATNLSSLIAWETLSQEDKSINYSIMSVYNYVNTNGNDGIQTDELKAGALALKDYTNQAYGMNLSMGTTEVKSDTIEFGIDWFFDQVLVGMHSPAILYGNTKDGYAGYHYYMVTGAIRCPSNICGSEYNGMLLNDSVYNSPAYPADSDKRKNALSPGNWVSQSELETYWKKTGSRYPWNRTHIMLTFPNGG